MTKPVSIASLGGISNNRNRDEDDFYATQKDSVRDLFKIHNFGKDLIFNEPCVGQGHIADVIKENNPLSVFTSDLVDRGYPGTKVYDYLENSICPSSVGWADWVITNPPFKHAKEFTERALSETRCGVAMFLRIQFLESLGRKEWLQSSPLKHVYVFSKRQAPLRGGTEIDPRTGKKWGSAMCFAWFLWEHGYEGDPMIKWI